MRLHADLEFLHPQGCYVGHSIIAAWIQVQNGGPRSQSRQQFVTALTSTVLMLMISDDCSPYVSACISQHCGNQCTQILTQTSSTTAITLHLLMNMVEYNSSLVM